MLNKTDVEILWTLKELSKNSTKSDIVKSNDSLTFNDNFRMRLLFLKDGDFVTMESVQDYGIHYGIKKKALDLIWSDVTRDNILNLLSISEYPINKITQFMDDSAENIRDELNSLKLSDSPLIESVMTNDEEQFKLTVIGKQHFKD
ncbi:MAG: hypothetical protein GKS07_09495 [Nitrosopumilus sp.]|nr:MAG: hypothetical protein GKS07_09495 [Nitrosopumilus sp.]